MVEEIHVEDISELVSLVLSLIISWIFRILNKTVPGLGSGTPVLVKIIMGGRGGGRNETEQFIFQRKIEGEKLYG